MKKTPRTLTEKLATELAHLAAATESVCECQRPDVDLDEIGALLQDFVEAHPGWSLRGWSLGKVVKR